MSRIELVVTALGIGRYLYLPFQVPDGVNRVSVSLHKPADASVGIGLFDHRGPEYGSPGFRGVYGDEAGSFFVAADSASRAFRPGRIEPGTWTVVVPVFRVLRPTPLAITVTLEFGPQPSEAAPGPEPGVVRDRPGWYRGDLHNHTTHSSDAYASGGALGPADYPAAMRRSGLDWVVLTDHNVTTSNDHLAEAVADSGVLLIGGMEMTNWPHGHATVSGLEPGDWVDWRQRPAGVSLGRYERRIDALMTAVRQRGGYLSAAHPMSGHLSWQFLAEQTAEPSLLPDGLEVWNGPHQPDDEAAMLAWDALLRAGHRVSANGGSDLHSTANPAASALGVPTTVVYAESLSRRDVVAALKAGRGFVTSAPDGPELYLEAEGPGGQHAMMGGEVTATATESVTVTVLVRGGAGRSLLLLRDGVAVQATPISSDEQTVTLRQPLGAGGYVRAELRGTSTVDPGDPDCSRTGMAALTNPIFLVPTSAS
ncbi:MAG TPA: CehA/McbA family metallohydrolase [Micromonosporaceae bacterium]